MTDTISLETHFKGKAPKPIVLVGDVMLDQFIYGDVSRISPEGPIPVMKISHQNEMLGGAGNVLRNILSLQTPAVFATIIGNDEAGEKIAELIKDYGKIKTALVTENSRPTTIKVRYVAQGQQLLRADTEADRAISSGTEQKIADKVEAFLNDASVLVMSDYGKGMLTPTLISALIKIAKRKKIPVLVDPKGRDYAKYKGATIISPNLKELVEATGIEAKGHVAVTQGAKKLMTDFGFEAVLVTLGAEGMLLVTAKGKPLHLQTQAKEVYDVSGAGDTVLATLATCMARGLSLESAVAVANVAAGIVVGKAGTATVHLDELKAAVENPQAQTKSMTLSQAVMTAKDWRKKGLTVGFTNGCFDLIHPGHIHSIREAKAHCDRLIVGLNADASIKRLKGDGRPVQHEAARATVLGAMADVDGIILFDEDTPLHLINAIRPDVLLKGKDYKLNEVVGAKEVMAYGGQVVLVDLLAGHSTTGLIKKSK